MEHLSLLDVLRQQTASLHQQVERQGPMSCLMSTDLDDDSYLDALYLLHEFVATLERSLTHHFSDPNNGYYYMPRVSELMRDIHQLRGITPTTKAAAIEPCYYHALGMAYVIEGSSAGGKILAKRLARQLNRDKNTGIGYFNFHRRGTWSLFQQWLATLNISATQQQQCISGAVNSFKLLLRSSTVV